MAAVRTQARGGARLVVDGEHREIWVSDADRGKLKRKTFSAPQRSAAIKAARNCHDAHPGAVAPSAEFMTVAGV